MAVNKRTPVRICRDWDAEYLFTIDLIPSGPWVFLPGIATGDGQRYFDGVRALVDRREVAPIRARAERYPEVYNLRA